MTLQIPFLPSSAIKYSNNSSCLSIYISYFLIFSLSLLCLVSSFILFFFFFLKDSSRPLKSDVMARHENPFILFINKWTENKKSEA